MSDAYRLFLEGKTIKAPLRGLSSVPSLAAHLFAFQAGCTDFLLRAGSGGLFLDTGLGKTACELEWSRHALDATNGYALILTPLAVARQIEREAHRFGYDARVIREQGEAKRGINICNYDRLDKLDPGAFGSVVLDESSILKSFTGKTTRALIAAFAGHRFRLAATATPAPNDHVELAQHAEFLGVMARDEMLVRWFINDASDTKSWRLKQHGVAPFFDWMASWSRMAEHPRDLGDDREGFDLPALNVHRHRAESDPRADAAWFGAEALSATTLHDVKRQTAEARAEAAVKIVAGGPSWTPKLAATTCAVTENNIPRSGDEPPSSACAETPCVGRGTPPTRDTEIASRLPSGTPLGVTPSATNPNGSAKPSASNGRTTARCSTGKTGRARSAARGAPDGTDTSTSTTATSPAGSGDFSAETAISGSASSATTPRILNAPPSTSERPTSWLLWCDTDAEQDAIERALARECGPSSFLSVRGSQSADAKERAIDAWLVGERPIMLSKPSIMGYGMNFQHCHSMIFVGRSFSYESWYQAVRRCWRFGQTRPVDVHLIVAEGEDAIGRVIDRKAGDHKTMKSAMVAAMRRAIGREAHVRVAYEPKHEGRLPAWLS